MGVGKTGQHYFEQNTVARPLQFRHDQGRRAGMRAMLLVYPSSRLAEIADPLSILAERTEPLSLKGMREAVAARLQPTIRNAQTGMHRATADGHGWEWAAPIALDAISGSCTGAWLESPEGSGVSGNGRWFSGACRRTENRCVAARFRAGRRWHH